MRKSEEVTLHYSLGEQEIFWNYRCGLCIARRAETTLAVFTKTRAVTNSIFSKLSKHGARQQRNLLTGSTHSRAQGKTCRNGRHRKGLRLWMGLTNELTMQRESVGSGTILGS